MSAFLLNLVPWPDSSGDLPPDSARLPLSLSLFFFLSFFSSPFSDHMFFFPSLLFIYFLKCCLGRDFDFVLLLLLYFFLPLFPFPFSWR